MKMTKGRQQQKPESPSWYAERKHLLACLALVALTLAAYSNSFSAGFALDAPTLIRDARVHELNAENLHNIFWHSYWWPGGEAGLYRPLTNLSILFNYAILGNGENPAGYHWINWLLHSSNVLLLFALALRLVRSFRISISIAALWALHPLLTEAVTNVAGRSDLLAGAALLAGLLAYLKSTESKWWFAALALASAAGVASKESAAVLPALLVLYESAFGNRTRLRTMIEGFVASSIPIAAVLLQRFVVLRMSLPAEFPFVDNPIVRAGFLEGRLTALAVMARYLWLTIWPARLSADYSFAQIPLATGSAADWMIAVLMLGLSAAVLVAYRFHRTVFFFGSFALLTLLPAANLLFPTGTIMAERLLYMPLIGLLAILAIAVEAAAKHVPRAAVVVFALIVAGYGARTFARNFDWQSDHTMALADGQVSPQSFKVHRFLALDRLSAEPTRPNTDQAVSEADRSIALLANVPDEDNSSTTWTTAARAHLQLAQLLTNPDDVRREYARVAELAQRSLDIESSGRAGYNRRHGTTVEPTASVAECYRILAHADNHLDRPAEELAAATAARKIDATGAEVYAEIAEADYALHRDEEGAIVLIEGLIVTEDAQLRKDLMQLYEAGVDETRCAISAGPAGPVLNPNCEIVHRDFCQAASRVHRTEVSAQFNCASQ